MSRQQSQRSMLFNSLSGFEITLRHHVIFWLVYLIFNILRWGSYYDDYWLSIKGNLIGFPIHILLSYFTVYYLLPRFISSRRFLSFTLILLTAIFTMVVVKYFLTYFLISQNVWPEGPQPTHQLTFNYVVNMMVGEFYVISFVAAIKITVDWLQENRRVSKLEKAQLETELRFLKAQISPHFFFNTLNNIYSLSLEKSHKASENILKLSDLMRYFLYETRSTRQDLQKEIRCIRNYLDLEKIRYGDFLKIDLQIYGDPKGKKIAPMLLIPFVENAFKHGANKSLGPVTISIQLQIEEESLYFKVENTLPPKNDLAKKVQGGIGIANVRKRLELDYSEEDYELKNVQENGKYIVELKLKM